MSTVPPVDPPQESVPTITYPEPVPAVNHQLNRQARDKAQYVRQQKGHSFIIHWLFLGVFSMFIVPIYYSVSPNHYWHL